MADTRTFVELRPLLFSIAYRMLGSVTEAEDVLQDAFLRWRQVPDAEVTSPRSFLAAVVTRLCIDQLRSARVRRETYVGPWLPEPLVTESVPDVAEQAELADSISMAFLVLLESLSPQERAAFLLHDVFGFGFAEIARIIGRSEEASRQLASRGRKALADRRPRFEADERRRRELTERFLVAVGSGDLSGLVELLAQDVVLTSDGGGKVAAARRPVVGPDRVARFLLGVASTAPPDLEIRVTEVNGQPGILGFADGAPVTAMVLEIAEGRIAAIRVVVNPDKLRPLAAS